MACRQSCKRRTWLKFTRCIIAASVCCLVLWTYRSWVIHAFQVVSSASYRECVSRRRAYSYSPDASNKKQNLFVTVANHGRLGNWMYQYASLLGIAKANGRVPYFINHHPLNYNFKLSKTRMEPADCLVTVEDAKPITYTEALNHLPEANVTLDGYFQSWKYFTPIQEELRREFRFEDDIAGQIKRNFKRYMGQYIEEGREIISIHVRRGDVAGKGAKRLGFKPAPASYFANAIRYMIKRHPFSAFIVVSDEMDWCRKHIKPVTLRYIVSSNVENKSDERSGTYVVISDGIQEPVVRDSVSKNSLESLQRLVRMTVEKSGEINRNRNSKEFDLETVPIYFTPPHASIVDMGLLSLANHSILSMGTFGWWGAWLAGGETVYYDDWLIEDHVVYLQWTKGDFYPPQWVALSGTCQSTMYLNVANFRLLRLCTAMMVVIFM